MQRLRTPKIIAHRGARHEAPENTQASIDIALAIRGLDGVEFDVELSGDGKSVVVHQETMVPDAAFNELIPATRDFTFRDWVGENTSDKICKLDAGTWFARDFRGQKVTTLQQMLARDWQNKKAYVELKDATYWGTKDPSRPKRIVEAALPDLRSFSGSLHIITFNPEILREASRRLPGVPASLALWTEWQDRTDEAIKLARDVGATALLLADVMVLGKEGVVELIRSAGIELHTYPVSPAIGEPGYDSWSPSSQVPKWEWQARAGVDALISDFPRETQQALDKL
jgi:glycerophosphoryl diester phosphodiesterase